MANRIGAGGPFLVPPSLPVTSPVDEEGDAWWSGVQLNFAGVVLGVNAAALSLAASLCFGLQQQVEEYQVVPSLVGSETWQVTAIGIDTLGQAVSADEELPVTPAIELEDAD